MSVFGDFRLDGAQLIARETGAAIPLTPGFARDALSIASFVWLVNALRATRRIRRREARARIFFFPRKPRSYYAIWPVCQLADVKIVNDPQEADLHFYFEDVEFLTAPRAAPTPRPAFNIGCHDIRKSVVARTFEEIFGYPLSVDPLEWRGPAVEKSEGNGRHDGRIVTCPLDQAGRGMVYQRVIDNTFDGRDHIDIRTPIVGRAIPFVYLKRRTSMARFTNNNDRVDLAPAEAMLSAREQANIIAFARALRLDFGGIDVLRDRADGRIYLVDANKTDMGPPSALSANDKLKAMRGLAQAFAEMVDAAIAKGAV